MQQMSLAVDARNALGEGVRWCEESHTVFWTDILGARLWRYAPDTGKVDQWPMPERLASFALTSIPGRLLLGLESRLAFFHLNSGSVTPICDVEPELPSTRINDARCDRQGRFIFGTLNEEKSRARIGSFYRLDADLRLEKLSLPNVAIPNSICFSPDGRRMYYCDSLAKQIRVCAYEPLTGALGVDTLFVDLHDEPGEPDGSTVDREGCVWNAQWGGARLVRYSPNGETMQTIALPVLQPTCIAFGGRKLDRLYVTSARCDLDEAQLATSEWHGGMLCLAATGATGLPENRFAG